MNGFEYVGLNLFSTLLLDAFGRSTLLLVAVWIVTRCLRRMSAARQHFLWLSALVGIVYVTGASLVLPVRNALGLPTGPVTMPVTVWHYTRDKQETVTSALYHQFTDHADGPTLLVSSLPSAVVSHSTGFQWSVRTVFWLKVIWPIGFLLTLLRFARNRRAVRLLQRNSRPLTSPRIQSIMKQTAARLGLPCLPILLTLESDHSVFSPLTWGWRRTFLLLPAEVEYWPTESLEAVLLHELAHIQRGDWFTQRIGDAVCALFWFHPLVWLAAKNLRACAERACDDMALTNGMAPNRYAQHLLAIAQSLRTRPLDSATISMTLPFLSHSQLETRLRAILDGSIPRRAFSRTGQRSLLGVGAFGLMPFALVLPVTTQNVRYIVAGPVSAINGKATLSEGGTVELVGVVGSKRNPTSEPMHWWKADGTPLAEPLYAPTMLQSMYAQKLGLTGSALNRACILKMSGLRDKTASVTQSFTPQTLVSSGNFNTWITHVGSDAFYEANAGFTHLPKTASLHLGIAQGAWQTAATTTTLPSVLHDSEALTITFRKPDKIDAGVATVVKEPDTWQSDQGKGNSELAVIIRFEKNQPEKDVARRVILQDDQGKTFVFNDPTSLLYTGEQKGRPELHILIAVPKALRGHIRQYQLQSRPYQYVDFPNIAMNPTAS